MKAPEAYQAIKDVFQDKEITRETISGMEMATQEIRDEFWNKHHESQTKLAQSGIAAAGNYAGAPMDINAEAHILVKGAMKEALDEKFPPKE